MNKWSNNSIKNIHTVYKVIQILAEKLIGRSPYDLTVLNNGGRRDEEMQMEIYLTGNSKCDGVIKISFHQSGMAIDFVPYIKGKPTWSNGFAFLSIASEAFKIWAEMEESGETEGYYLHWGGFWGAKDLDGDGLLEIEDSLGWDMAHYEIRKYKQKNTYIISV